MRAPFFNLQRTLDKLLADDWLYPWQHDADCARAT